MMIQAHAFFGVVFFGINGAQKCPADKHDGAHDTHHRCGDRHGIEDHPQQHGQLPASQLGKGMTPLPFRAKFELRDTNEEVEMAKRARRLFAPEARKLLIDFIPLLKSATPESSDLNDLDDAVATTRLLRRAIASEDLGLLLSASASDKAEIVRRIHGFAVTEGADEKLLIGRIPPEASDRAPLFLAMQRLCHQSEFDYAKRFRELPEKEQYAAHQRTLERLRRAGDDEQ